jgi:hypothetical protein
MNLALEIDILESVFELGQLPPSIHKAVNACPGGVGIWVNVKAHSVTFFAPSGARLKACPICHNDVDGMILWVNIFLHSPKPLIKTHYFYLI